MLGCAMPVQKVSEFNVKEVQKRKENERQGQKGSNSGCKHQDNNADILP